MPSAAEQRGDFSGIGHPLINFAAGGILYPNNQIPTVDFDKVAVNAAALYPNGNVSPFVYTATVVGANDDDQTGSRFDFHQNDRSQFFSQRTSAR